MEVDIIMIFGLEKESLVHLLLIRLKKNYSADEILEDVLLNMSATDLIELMQRKGVKI